MTEEKKNELLLEQVTSLMQQTNNDVIAVICNRIKTIGEMSATDAIKLSNMARTTDLEEIEDILAKNTELSKKAVDEIVEKSAENNDELSAQYYKHAGKTKNEKVLETIKSRAKKSISKGLINLSDTTAFIMDGKPLNIRETYTKAINSAIYATQQGLTDYNTAIRTTVRNLADSGLRVVDFDSGYHRRLDSQARMNILDGMRQLNQEYREEQGQEFGADGVEISVHGMCAPDHQDIQGQQYSKEDFEKLQSRLLRPIGTLNCHHTTFPIILGVSKPAYTKKRLKEIKAQSNAPVQYTDKLGNDKVVSAYDSTQKQREQETIIRRLKDRREAFRASGDNDEVAKLNKQITAQSRYYRKMSAEVGLEPKMERTRVIKAKVKKDPANVAKFVEDKSVVNGKDITKTWTRRKDKFAFDIEDAINAQGFDGLPKVVSEKEFDEYVKSSKIIAQRTYSAPTKEILEEYQNQLYKGKWYVDCSAGGSLYGQGMYCACDYTGKLSSGIKEEMEYYKELNADKGNALNIVETLTLDKSAKIINYDDLIELKEKERKRRVELENNIPWKNRTEEEYMADLAKARAYTREISNMDDGVYATLLGYDAINAEDGASGSYTVILNRTKVIFKRR